MKSKAPLVMMEQIVMVLVFALAAALCLQTFVLSGNISERTEEVNRAAIEAQNVAEELKSEGLKAYLQNTESFRIAFDHMWNKVKEPEQTEYILEICPINHSNEFFWQADIAVMRKDGAELFRIPVAGQTEVAGYE